MHPLRDTTAVRGVGAGPQGKLPRMYGNVVGVDNDAVKIGDRLEVVFDAVTPEIAIPKFRPSES